MHLVAAAGISRLNILHPIVKNVVTHESNIIFIEI